MSSRNPPAALTPEKVGLQCAALHSRVLSRLVTRLYNQHLNDSGLRVTQFSVLNAIKARPPESIFQLAELLGMERTSLQRTVDKLIEKGLVASEPTGNKRALGLSLTPAGEACYQQALAGWQAAQQQFESLVGKKSWQQISSELRRFSHQVKQEL
ncbi:MarR family winged helix-turn-helix transcriptional regulator [Alcanivorax sp. S6407]|uniref:MarR family winged helix-turn-helix transcriptional regulator n=1 Tax=Alcanivorax sp. S6407 TaxID=2926424 RepID=UPI001FF0E022|nr:MarR family winged helix-turn-helix transcriptional regulator [Alcanivorax sp. S6407]MCK0154071.1 MarR family winged helix-turn-helix transcriptional regulator [Alcanivorax sp. S6407]